MLRKIVWSGVIIIALATPALAEDQCVSPKAPPIPDGAKATPAQIMTAQNDIKAFVAASDSYQACVAREIGRQKDVAKQNNVEFDATIQTALEISIEPETALVSENLDACVLGCKLCDLLVSGVIRAVVVDYADPVAMRLRDQTIDLTFQEIGWRIVGGHANRHQRTASMFDLCWICCFPDRQAGVKTQHT